MSNKVFLTIITTILVGAMSSLRPAYIYAEECENYACAAIENDEEREACVDKKIACYQQKIDDSRNQQTSLKNELTYIDNQIAYQETQIEKTRFEIVRAQKEVEVLSSRIENLSASMEKLAKILTELVAASYKKQHLSILEMYLASDKFSDALSRKQSEELISLQTSKILFRSMQEKLDFNQQKEARETLKTELEAKTERLKNQQAALETQKENKAILLQQTKNDEATYQKLLKQAASEADSFRRFAASAGGGSCLNSSPDGGSNGWYFSQRDPRWCKQYIGNSSLTVGEVGCYLTSVAMIHKSTGVSTTPSVIGANTNYYFASTALMLSPPSPAGHTYKRYDYFTIDTIDDELNQGRPVIVHVKTNNGWGGHFIVLYSGSSGSYKMHDPWYGADLTFNSYYSTGLIDSVRVFTK